MPSVFAGDPQPNVLRSRRPPPPPPPPESHVFITDGTSPQIMTHEEPPGMHYMRVHLTPDSDPIARAICEKLGIDWRALMKEQGYLAPEVSRV